MARTSKRLAARTAARQRQVKADAEQRRRAETELAHATEFEIARMRRDEAVATVATHEMEMARQVDTLLALGNSTGRVAELTGETDTEIKRLRRLTLADTNLSTRSSTRSARQAPAAAGRGRASTRPPESAAMRGGAAGANVASFASPAGGSTPPGARVHSEQLSPSADDGPRADGS